MAKALFSDVIETVTSDTETKLKLRDEDCQKCRGRNSKPENLLASAKIFRKNHKAFKHQFCLVSRIFAAFVFLRKCDRQ